MKEKPIKTCTGLNCPERICSECQVGRSIKSTGEYTSQFICNNCQESFVGNPCTAGEENWKELDEITETINNTKYVEAKLVKELLKSEREKLMNDADEANLARSDGFPTSLFNKIKKLK